MAVDAPNVVYRHLFQIRGPDGEPYRNVDGVRIGHLVGLCNEISTIARTGMRPVFVFDGRTPRLKQDTAKKRATSRAHRLGFKLAPEMVGQMERTLDLLGLPRITAPEEAEAQAAFMTRSGAWSALTNDYDALLFGASRVIRAISKSGAEMVLLSDVLNANSIDLTQLIRVGALTGTDYNPGGVRGVGTKRALRLVRGRASLREIAEELGIDDQTSGLIREVEAYYLNPPVMESWRANWLAPDSRAARAYLVGEMKLSARSLDRTIDLLRGTTSSRQTSLAG